jgi:putative ABC transport system substrate-binding protein
MRRREFIAVVGGVVALPLTTRAQQPAVPVIGYLSGGAESGDQNFTNAFRQGLNEQGYIERRNVEILYRWAEMRNDRLPALATDWSIVGSRSLSRPVATPLRWLR